MECGPRFGNHGLESLGVLDLGPLETELRASPPGNKWPKSDMIFSGHCSLRWGQATSLWLFFLLSLLWLGRIWPRFAVILERRALGPNDSQKRSNRPLKMFQNMPWRWRALGNQGFLSLIEVECVPSNSRPIISNRRSSQSPAFLSESKPWNSGKQKTFKYGLRVGVRLGEAYAPKKGLVSTRSNGQFLCIELANIC